MKNKEVECRERKKNMDVSFIGLKEKNPTGIFKDPC